MILNLGGNRKLVLGIILFVNSYLLAHNPNEAFFTISTNGNYTEVVAELPWSVRNDLILYRPELENSKSDQDYKDAFESYIQQKLILRLQSGEKMSFVSVKEEVHNGHSHQNNFRISYQGSEVHQVENTILFASYENQKNYHFLIKENKKLTYITRPGVPSFTIADTNYWHVNSSKYWIITVLILLSLLSAIYFKRKPKH